MSHNLLMFDLGVVMRIFAQCLPKGMAQHLLVFAKQALKSGVDKQFRRRMYSVLVVGALLGVCLGWAQGSGANTAFGLVLGAVGIFTVIYIDTFAELIVRGPPVVDIRSTVHLPELAKAPVGFPRNILRPPIL